MSQTQYLSEDCKIPGTKDALPVYRLNDHVGSLAVLTSSTGQVQGSVDYLPFGQQLSSAPSSYAFTGLETDTDTNSVHATARQLSLSQSRWLSPDPSQSSYDLMNPQSLNRYAYVGGQPLNHTDPSGLLASNPGGGGGSGSEDCGIFCFIGSLFGGGQPAFTGTINPPVASMGLVTGDSLGMPRTQGIVGTVLDAADVPIGGGCEFGPCGFQRGVSSGVSTSSRIYIPGEVWIWASKQHTAVHLPWHYGAWCGPGGRGDPWNDTDRGCLLHDYCFASAHIDASAMLSQAAFDNLGSEQKQAALGCNQQLCENEQTAATGLPSWSYQLERNMEIRAFFTDGVPHGARCWGRS